MLMVLPGVPIPRQSGSDVNAGLDDCHPYRMADGKDGGQRTARPTTKIKNPAGNPAGI